MRECKGRGEERKREEKERRYTGGETRDEIEEKRVERN